MTCGVKLMCCLYGDTGAFISCYCAVGFECSSGCDVNPVQSQVNVCFSSYSGLNSAFVCCEGALHV